jgi:hypothetical protein
LCRTMECNHEVALRRGPQAFDEHLMLTKDLQVHLGPLHHHLQTLLDSLMRHGTKSECAACCLHFTRVLLAPRFYKPCILKSSGRTHAHGMASILPCGFIAQQCLVLASLSLIALFIAQARP